MPTVRILLLAVAVACIGTPPAPPNDVAVVRVPNGGIQPQAERDRAGNIHLLYFAGEPSAGDLYYVRSSDDGTTFSKPLRVNSEAGSAIASGSVRGGRLALGINGRPHVAWNGSGKTGPAGPQDPVTKRSGTQMFYTRLDEAGTAFEPQRGLMQHTVNLDGGGTVAADGTGNVYVAWHANDMRNTGRTEADRAVWIARSSDGGKTFATETRAWNEPTGACGCCTLELLASSDALLMLYRSASAGGTQRDIYFIGSTDHGHSFAGTRIHPWRINACPMTSMSLAAANGSIFGAWETEASVFFGKLDAREHRALGVVEAPVERSPAKHPRIAVNPKGQALLVWTEGTGYARGGSFAWELFDADGRPTRVAGHAPGIPALSFAAAVSRRDGGFVVFY
jgi:hypothetical protein